MEELRARYDDEVAANNILLFIAGNFELERTKELILQHFSDVPAKALLETSTVLVTQSKRRMMLRAPILKIH